MTTRLRPFLTSLACIGLMLYSVAQDRAVTQELERYTNDSLGFSIDLPCTPSLHAGTIPGTKPTLGCMQSIPMVMIHCKNENIKNNKEMDAYIKKQIQVDGTPVTIDRKKIDGKRARRISLIANGQLVESVIIAHDNKVYMFALIQPSALNTLIDPRIIGSIAIR